jgi:DnaK suppressor protein
LSKTPASKAAPKKAAGKAAKASAKAAVKARPATTKPAGKPRAPAPKSSPAKAVARRPPKSAPAPSAKSAPKVPTKAPAKTPAKVAAKPAAKAPVKTTPVKAPPAAATQPVKLVTQADSEKTIASKAATTARRSAGGRQSHKPGIPPPVQAPLPAPTSRFADRFAPPRPPTRQMNHLEYDTPRQPQVSDPKLANAWKSKAGRDLTEAELLAMPESEYMNEKQLEFFRVTLQKLKDDLLNNAGETTEHLREDTSIVPDPADRATIEEEHALELRTRDRERKLLKKISQSLARIESGDYGFCDETGEPIGLGRLIARPTATLSLEAQQRRELKQKMFGD